MIYRASTSLSDRETTFGGSQLLPVFFVHELHEFTLIIFRVNSCNSWILSLRTSVLRYINHPVTERSRSALNQSRLRFNL